MTPLPPTSARDPRADNAARQRMLDILAELVPPANYKVVLDVDRATERLRLRVLKRDAYVVKIWGFVIWRHAQGWDHPEAELRRLEARTYEALMEQLLASPEFLEFEFAMEGGLDYRIAAQI